MVRGGARRIGRGVVAAALLALLALFGAPRLARADAPTAVRSARDLVGAAPGVTVHTPPLPRAYVVVHRGPLTIAYPPALEPQVRATVEHAEGDARTVATQLGLSALPPLEVRLVPDPDAMRQLAPPEVPPPAYAVGVAYPELALTLVSTTAPRTWEAPDLRRVLRHELSHLLLESAVHHAPIPRWLSEGVAIYQAAEHSYDRFTTLARATFTNGLVPLRRLDAAFDGSDDEVNVAYAQAADVVRFLLDRGPARFAVLLTHVREGMSLDDAVRQTYGASLAQLELEWRDDVGSRFLAAPLWAGTGFLWLVGAVLLLAAYVRRRSASRATLSRWAREETAAPPVVTVVAPVGGGALAGVFAIGAPPAGTPTPPAPDALASSPAPDSPDAPPDDAPRGGGDARPAAPDEASETPPSIFLDGRRHTLN